MIDFSKFELDKFVEIYKITTAGQAWYYTAGDTQVVFEGNTYLPTAISRGNHVQDSELNKTQMEITFPISDLATRFVTYAPVRPILVDIYLYQDNDNVLHAFSGEFVKITLSEKNTCVALLDEKTALEIKLPRLLISPACNHIWGDEACGINKADWQVSATITAINGNEYEATVATVFAAQWFHQGIAKFENEIRAIADSAVTDGSGPYSLWFTLQIPLLGVEVGDTITLLPGCDKEPTTCKDKFDNLSHYLGCPYVPRKNPVFHGL